MIVPIEMNNKNQIALQIVTVCIDFLTVTFPLMLIFYKRPGTQLTHQQVLSAISIQRFSVFEPVRNIQRGIVQNIFSSSINLPTFIRRRISPSRNCSKLATEGNCFICHDFSSYGSINVWMFCTCSDVNLTLRWIFT